MNYHIPEKGDFESIDKNHGKRGVDSSGDCLNLYFEFTAQPTK